MNSVAHTVANTLANILGTIAFFSFIAFLIWLGAKEAAAKKRMAFEARKQLLDKFSTAEELTGFLSSEAGKQFFVQFASPQATSGALTKLLQPQPLAGVLTLLFIGIVGVSLGVAFFIIRGISGDPGFAMVGVIVGLPSIAMLIAAGVTYRLKKKWGLLTRQPE
jgi:hypothetical protein